MEKRNKKFYLGLTALILLSFGITLKSADATCLENLQKKISKETKFFQNRKNHPDYSHYEILKAAKKILPLYEKLSLNVSFNSKKDELENLEKILKSNYLSRRKSRLWTVLMAFYQDGQLGQEIYKGNSLIKTLLAINHLNDNFCTENRVISREDFVKEFARTYQDLLLEKDKTQKQTINHQILLGSDTEGITAICEYDAKILHLSHQYLDLGPKVLVERPSPANLQTHGLAHDPDQCPCCFSEFDETTKGFAGSCGHKTCQDCLHQHFKAKLDQGVNKILCVQPGCGERLRIFGQNFASGLTKEAKDSLEKLIDKQLTNKLYLQKNKFVKCHHKDCSHFFKKWDWDDLRQLNCPNCSNITCLFCGNHHGKDCPAWTKLKLKQESEDEVMRKNGFMDCPYCGTWAMRESGCSYVNCINCRNNFDFITGGPWDNESFRRQAAYNNGAHYGETPSATIKKDPKLIGDRNFYRNKW